MAAMVRKLQVPMDQSGQMLRQHSAAWSPICEFVFCIACARGTKTAAGAENPVPLCSDRTGHSRKPQQGLAVEFTECHNAAFC